MAHKTYKVELNRQINDLVNYATRWHSKIHDNSTDEDMIVLDAMIEALQAARIAFPKVLPLPNA